MNDRIINEKHICSTKKKLALCLDVSLENVKKIDLKGNEILICYYLYRDSF